MIENVYPLSPLQEGIYYHWLMAPESPVYFDQLSYTVKGKIDIPKLGESYGLLVARHAILRTFFTQEFGDKALQVVAKEVTNNFEFKDCTTVDNFDAEALKVADRAKGFNLQAGSQMRLTVLGLGDDNYEFIWSFHHILMDGWCVGILVGEFFQLYQGLLSGVKLDLGRVYPYVNYIQWLGKVNQQESIAYWKEYLQGYETACTLPKLLNNIAGKYQMQEAFAALPPADRQAMRALCAELGITENVFIQTVWGILLGIYNNTDDVVFGAVVSGRPAEIPGIEQIIGLFINTIPVRVRSHEGQTASELLKEVHGAAIASTKHHYTQLAQVQAESGLGSDLLDHILVFENYPVQEMIAQDMQGGEGDENGLMLMATNSIEQTNYNFNIILLPGENFVVKFSYNACEYAPEFMEQVKNNLLTVIHQVLAHPNMAVSTINCLTNEEKQQLTVAFNDTAVDYPAGKTVVEVFEAQVAATPDRVALRFEDVSFTYQQLNELCNQAAHYLRTTQDIKADDVIAMQLQRSHWQIITILSILKAGAAYLPIDTDYPQERVTYLLEDSRCKLVINDAALEQLLPAIAEQPKNNPVSITNADSLVYIMYTSGSTGMPKGVMVHHGGAVRLVKPLRYMNFTGNEVLLSAGAISFDATTFEFWSTLLNGGTLVMCSKEVLLDTSLMAETIKKYKVDTMFFTSGWLNQLVDNDINLFEGLRTIKAGGDRLSPMHIHALKQKYPKLTIVNGYGPTENTGASCCYTIHEVTGHIPIGKPIDNSTAWIIDAHNRLVPIGVTGELCVGGAGLARGYLNNPALTAEKFIDNPFQTGTRMYKTGDLARWLPDGNIEFVGRKDDQVKIRGYRIEPGEIEAVLQTYPAVEDAVVVAKHNIKGEKELVAYVTGKETINDATELSAYLGSQLPFYMVPVHYVQLPEFPLNSNGKVDRKKLPDPEGLGIGTGVEYVAPRTETEEKLVRIWQEILGREKIGVKDNFFAIGGHSLKATRVASSIRKEFNVTLSLPVLFSNPTIENIAGEIEKTYWANNELFDIEDADSISL